MAKPMHTFMLINGKAKVVADAQESRGKVSQGKPDQHVNAVDYLLERAKVAPSKLRSGLQIVEDAKKASKDRIDHTKLGKLKEVIKDVKELVEQFEKLGSDEKKALAELGRPTTAIVRANPKLESYTDLKAFTNFLDVVVIFLMILIKIRAKGTR